jgi:hypothetical protein
MATILCQHHPTATSKYGYFPLTVALRRSPQCEEELAAVAVLAAVSHAENARSVMLQLEPRLFVVELAAINAVTTRAIT